MNFFPHVDSEDKTIIFEKSANYFDQSLVPSRLHALIPKAKIIVILISAKKRAYSWYQHMRAHGDSIANNYSFHEVVTGTAKPLNNQHKRALRGLRNHCLQPGYYAQHLERWLSFFSPQNLMIIDGEELKSEPFVVLNQLQDFLDVQKIDYTKLIKFDKRKGFFCQIKDESRTLCLGKGKGRRYPPMDLLTENYLQKWFAKYNASLVKLLRRLKL